MEILDQVITGTSPLSQLEVGALAALLVLLPAVNTLLLVYVHLKTSEIKIKQTELDSVISRSGQQVVSAQERTTAAVSTLANSIGTVPLTALPTPDNMPVQTQTTRQAVPQPTRDQTKQGQQQRKNVM